MTVFSSVHEQFVAITRDRQCRRQNCKCRQDPDRVQTIELHCPAHTPDAHPSFVVTELSDRIITVCRAGCSFDATSQALRNKGLWPDPPRVGLTLAAYAKAKALPEDFIKSFGIYEA